MSANMLPTGDPLFARALQQQLLAKMRELQIPGAIIHVDIPHQHRHALLYISQKQLPPSEWTIALGTSDLATNVPMDVKSYMRVGSITKTFIATIILQLVDKGDFGLDDPASNHLPDQNQGPYQWSWSNALNPVGNTITIRQLLNHTSGIFNLAEDTNLTLQEIKDPTRVWDPDEIIQAEFRNPPYFAPGQGWHYSDTNYIPLGLLIEKVTGMPVEKVLQQKICAPLGLDDTSMPARTSSAIPDPHPQAYTMYIGTGSPTLLPAWNPSLVWASGAAISTLHDLDIWAEALATGQLLSQAMHEAQLTFVPGTGYGLGVTDFGNGFVGHDGEVPGFTASMACRTTLERKAETLVVLSNLDIAPDGSLPADDLEAIVYQKLFAGQTRLGD